MKLKTLLIDLDGTLLGSHSFWLKIFFTFHFVHSLHTYGISLIKGIKILHSLKLSMGNQTHQGNGIVNWTKAIAFFSQLSGKSLEDSEKILTSTSMMCFKKSHMTLFPVPEAKEFIEWARHHFRLILATNPLWPLDVVLFRLNISEIEKNHFEFITHAGVMSASKPHIKYYQELQVMKNLDVQTCMMIGNDEKKDGPARKLGIDVFIIKKFSDFSKLKARLEKEMV